ncbi:2,3-diaminopropionate biosynthesis protein SbnB [Micromonospora terminaliae]|uniref:2,3-diaminopropionate biosynthesis protein SbnB n=1 Tax=Micromonospora terminaliae TaxID=1914461 RepID=A0AAJ2ZJJ5_9ACTN|nr:2,3-diaminopropionate biosynthesis protein SbnB [Micromonospora terminaliae]NES30203.1 2,3-diaminopropionate biosynthesis protein SbnB [Micromonospora terminaliae]QGL47026.1 2,3-diaminopropionate biosynthesis protein SbnB [Micromonospora terminaliae]
MFQIVPHAVAVEALEGSRDAVLAAVQAAYLAHDRGDTVNPSSHFLRFPDRPADRIIALPAYLGGEAGMPGLKWISSFPGNHELGLPRASAVLLLNDDRTGRPVACLEAAHISAARTAASAALAARVLRPWGGPVSLGFVGTGVIARTIAAYLHHTGLPVTRFVCHDLVSGRAEQFVSDVEKHWPGSGGVADLDAALGCDVVVLATTAGKPYLPETLRFAPGQTVLNVSLRDIHPQTLLATRNVVDDVDHCLRALTSPHLAEQLSGGREFVTGTLADVLLGKWKPQPHEAVVFSPFGLGVLDIAVGAIVLERAKNDARTVTVADFFED